MVENAEALGIEFVDVTAPDPTAEAGATASQQFIQMCIRDSYSQNTLLYGVEVKFYSSKVAVGERFETALPGFYAIGDGAGVTRGLMQASVTGVVVARDIIGQIGKM